MKLLIPSLLVLFFVACGDLSTPLFKISSNSSRSSVKVVNSSDVIVGSMTDSRDGQTYKTVKIGTQVWMAQNLNYKTADSYCYKDISSNCAKYGRLYTWAAAMDSAGIWSSNGKGCGYDRLCWWSTYPVRGVCPSGYHLPDTTEWKTLFTAVGGQRIDSTEWLWFESTAGRVLKSTSGWYRDGDGTDAFSFSALPAGGWSFDNIGYGDEGYDARFWSSRSYGSKYAYYMVLHDISDNAYLSHHIHRSGRYSVRCVKD